MLQLSQVFDQSYVLSMKVYNLLYIYVIGMMHLLDIISNLFLNFVRKGKKQFQLQYSKDSDRNFDSVNTECGEQITYNRSTSESAVHTTESEVPSIDISADVICDDEQNSYTSQADTALSYDAFSSIEQDTVDVANTEIRTNIRYDAKFLYTMRSDVIKSNYNPSFLIDNIVVEEINKAAAHAERSRLGALKKKIDEDKPQDKTEMIIDVEIASGDDSPTVHKAELKPTDRDDTPTVHKTASKTTNRKHATATKPKVQENDDSVFEDDTNVEENISSNQENSKTNEKNPEKKVKYSKKKATYNLLSNSKVAINNASTDNDWRRKKDSTSDEEGGNQKFKWYNRRGEQRRPSYQSYKKYTKENP